MAAGAFISWSRQQPFISPLEVQRATTAAGIADGLPPGTPLVFIVDDDDATVSFLATRAANVIGASMPPDRVADVFIYVGTTQNFLFGAPTSRGSIEYDAMSDLYLDDIPQNPRIPRSRSSWRRSTEPPARRPTPSHPLVAGCRPDGPRTIGDRRRQPIRWCRRRRGRSSSRRSSSLASPASSGSVGHGGRTRYSGVGRRRTGDRRGDARDRQRGARPLGLSLSGSAGPTVVALLAGGLGYALLVLQGKASPPSPPSIDEQPSE